MYGMLTYSWLLCGKCIGKYTSPMDPSWESNRDTHAEQHFCYRPRTNPSAIAGPRAASCTWIVTLQELIPKNLSFNSK